MATAGTQGGRRTMMVRGRAVAVPDYSSVGGGYVTAFLLVAAHLPGKLEPSTSGWYACRGAPMRPL